MAKLDEWGQQIQKQANGPTPKTLGFSLSCLESRVLESQGTGSNQLYCEARSWGSS